MNRNVIIGIISAIILVLAIVLAVFFMKGKQPVTQDNTEQDNNSTVDTNQMATDIQKYQEDRDTEDIKKDLDKQATQQQIDAMDDVIQKVTLPDNAELNDKGDVIVKDEEGNELEVNVSSNDERIDAAETDEELEDIYNELRSVLEGNKTDTNIEVPDVKVDDTSSNNPNNPNNPNNTNTDTKPNNQTNNDVQQPTDTTQPEENTQLPEGYYTDPMEALKALDQRPGGAVSQETDGKGYTEEEMEALSKLLGGN